MTRRAHHVHLPGDADPAETQRVLHGAAAGEGGVWDVLPGRRPVSQLLLALPHSVLPLRESVSHLLQVRSQRSVHTHICVVFSYFVFLHRCVFEFFLQFLFFYSFVFFLHSLLLSQHMFIL